MRVTVKISSTTPPALSSLFFAISAYPQHPCTFADRQSWNRTFLLFNLFPVHVTLSRCGIANSQCMLCLELQPLQRSLSLTSRDMVLFQQKIRDIKLSTLQSHWRFRLVKFYYLSSKLEKHGSPCAICTPCYILSAVCIIELLRTTTNERKGVLLVLRFSIVN